MLDYNKVSITIRITKTTNNRINLMANISGKTRSALAEEAFNLLFTTAPKPSKKFLKDSQLNGVIK